MPTTEACGFIGEYASMEVHVVTWLLPFVDGISTVGGGGGAAAGHVLQLLSQ